MPHLEVRNVSKSYGKHRALNNVSIKVPEKSVYGLLGPNGAGKTTLIRIITQIIGADEGEILFNGQPIKRENIAHIGYMPEERGLYRKMKVEEQIVYLAQLKDMKKQDAKRETAYWLERLGLAEWRDKKVEELSKGMQQKVQFIGTVVNNPELLILDEPFSGFDPVNAESIKQEILKLRDQGTTVILSTHRMESVEELCTRMALIHKSEVVIEGPIAEVREKYKPNIFRVLYRGNLQQQNLNGYELISTTTADNGFSTAHIKATEGVSTNQILQAILPHVEVLEFSEILPSIHDIFIKLVKENPYEEDTAHTQS